MGIRVTEFHFDGLYFLIADNGTVIGVFCDTGYYGAKVKPEHRNDWRSQDAGPARWAYVGKKSLAGWAGKMDTLFLDEESTMIWKLLRGEGFKDLPTPTSQDEMVEVLAELQQRFNGMGIALFVFDTALSIGGKFNYISNVERADFINTTRVMLDDLETRVPRGTHNTNADAQEDKGGV